MTIILRLFKSSEPARQIDSRTLDQGELRIGRDASQDWALDDPGRLISRSHLTIAVQGDGIVVTDTSSNGVFLAEREQRLPQGRPTPVDAGSTLRFGPYLLVVERAAPGRAAAPPPPRGDDLGDIGGRSPFAAPGSGGGFARPTAPDPFASALPADPLGFDLNPEPQGRGGRGAPPPTAAAHEDAWSRPRERRAGDWDAPAPKPTSHENLIGSGRDWREPPPAPPSEVGFGFDAPFSQPILKSVAVSKNDLSIPTDWDDAGTPAFASDRAPAAHGAAPAPDPWAREAPPAAPPAWSAPPPEPPPPAAPLSPAWEPPPAAQPAAAPSPWDAASASAPAPAPEPFAPPAPVRAAPAESAAAAFLAAEPVPPPAAPAAPPAPVSSPRAAPVAAGGDDAALLAAFCRGAKLDPQAFARVAPEEVMARVGVVYRQMILGMSDLMGERTSLKNEYRMVRTTVRAENNNPFKWLPPQAVATQLLLEPEEGFIGGAEAVQGAFKDLKKHLLCLLAGLRAALTAALDGLAPARVEAELKGQSMMMKNKGAAAWQEYGKLYADFRTQADDNPDSPINREFRAAYERQLTELDRITPG